MVLVYQERKSWPYPTSSQSRLHTLILSTDTATHYWALLLLLLVGQGQVNQYHVRLADIDWFISRTIFRMAGPQDWTG